jgi:hypothetical protein
MQTVSKKALPILKEVFMTLTLRRCPLKIWVFVGNITNGIIMGLDIMRAYDVCVDIWRQIQRLAKEELMPQNLGVRTHPPSLLLANDLVIPAQCEGVAIARLESPLGVENDLKEPNPDGRSPEGFYSARTLVRDRREVPVRILKATRRDQKLTKGFLLAHCETVTLVTPS